MSEVSMPHPAVVNEIARSLYARGDIAQTVEIGRFDTTWKNALLFTTKTTSNNTKAGTTTQVETAADKAVATQGANPKASMTKSVGVQLMCEECYVAGAASVTFFINGSTPINDTMAAYKDEAVKNMASIWADIEQWGDALVNETSAEITSWVTPAEYDFEFPPLNVDLDSMTVPDFPDVSLGFEFTEDFEVYLKLNAQLQGGATYRLTLFEPSSPAGYQMGNVLLGAGVKIELVLDLKAAVDLTVGAHLRLDKGTAFDIQLFSDKVSSLVLPGGQFEFLPVTLEVEDVTLHGVLAVTLKAGIELDSKVLNPKYSMSAGISSNIYAHVADFITTVKLPDISSSDDECAFAVENGFTFALGAGAGATVAAMGHTYGPVYATGVNLFSMTQSSCYASSATPTPTADALSTTTTTTVVTVTAKACVETGLINCPASLLRDVTVETTMSLTTAVPTGSTVDWATTGTAVVKKAFGTDARDIASQSGVPTEYTAPTPTPTANVAGGVDNTHNTGSRGIGLGLVPLIAFIAAVCIGL